jgi:hypothetical protein
MPGSSGRDPEPSGRAGWRSIGRDDKAGAPPQHRVDLDTVTEERRRALDNEESQPETIGAGRIDAVKPVRARDPGGGVGVPRSRTGAVATCAEA